MVDGDWADNKHRSCPRLTFHVVVIAAFFMLPHHAFAQQNSTLHRRPVQSDSAAAPKPVYQRSHTWYEFLLKQFNPNDFDYGRWMEERRRNFLDATIRNAYFEYSAGVTFVLVITILLYAKQWTDHRRVLWITAEMMTDLYNHDANSRQIARKAIEKFNAHIEGCNRAIESAEYGLAMPNQETDADRLRTELQRVTEERDSLKRERDLAKEDLAQKERILADLSLRVDALAKKPGTRGDNSVVVDPHASDQKLVQHINTLQEQLYSERRENRRLKGGA